MPTPDEIHAALAAIYSRFCIAGNNWLASSLRMVSGGLSCTPQLQMSVWQVNGNATIATNRTA
jgi:hypothetical protein